MTYTTEELSRMENMFAADPSMDLPMIDYDLESECLILEDISIGNSGMPDESYKKIAIPKFHPIVNGKILEGRIDEVAQLYEKDGWKVPSLPLYISILEKIVTDREAANHPQIRGRFDQITEYLDSPDRVFSIDEVKACNTIIDYEAGKIIHYPLKADMPNNMSEPGDNEMCRYEEHISNIELGDGIINQVTPEDVAIFFRCAAGIDEKDAKVLTQHYRKGEVSMDMKIKNSMAPAEYKGVCMPKMNTMGASINFLANPELEKSFKVPLFKVLEE